MVKIRSEMEIQRALQTWSLISSTEGHPSVSFPVHSATSLIDLSAALASSSLAPSLRSPLRCHPVGALRPWHMIDATHTSDVSSSVRMLWSARKRPYTIALSTCSTRGELVPRLAKIGSRLSLYIAFRNAVPRAVVSGVNSGNFLRGILSVYVNTHRGMRFHAMDPCTSLKLLRCPNNLFFLPWPMLPPQWPRAECRPESRPWQEDLEVWWKIASFRPRSRD